MVPKKMAHVDCALLFHVTMQGEDPFYLVGPSIEWAVETLDKNGYEPEQLESLYVLGYVRNALVMDRPVAPSTPIH